MAVSLLIITKLICKNNRKKKSIFALTHVKERKLPLEKSKGSLRNRNFVILLCILVEINK